MDVVSHRVIHIHAYLEVATSSEGDRNVSRVIIETKVCLDRIVEGSIVRYTVIAASPAINSCFIPILDTIIA